MFARRSKIKFPPLRRLFLNNRIDLLPLIRRQIQHLRDLRALERKGPALLQFNLAKSLDLPVWNKPSMPCTSSRVPHGTPIVPGLLRQIETAESAMLAMGFEQLRVRHHGDVARIELPAEDLARAIEHREAITAAVKKAGYKFVTLDLAGFKSGSLHAATK